MIVSLNIGINQYVERMTVDQWRQFVDNLDKEPLRIGGMTVAMKGKTSAAVIEQTKHYFRRVDDCFQRFGHTLFLEG